MDLIEGRSLARRLSEEGPLPPREAAALVLTLSACRLPADTAAGSATTTNRTRFALRVLLSVTATAAVEPVTLYDTLKPFTLARPSNHDCIALGKY